MAKHEHDYRFGGTWEIQSQPSSLCSGSKMILHIILYCSCGDVKVEKISQP